MKYFIESTGYSDIGCFRENNEDYWDEYPAKQFYILADGMGGHQAGEVASQMSTKELINGIKKINLEKLSAEQAIEELKKLVIQVNQKIYNIGKSHFELRGMGTTLCCLLFKEEQAILANIGDSRIYLYRKHLQQLSKDHSYQQELILKFGDSYPHSFKQLHKNVITKALGITPYVEPNTKSFLVESDDIYLLCSDGLTDYVENKQIEKVLADHNSLEEAKMTLIELAKNNGSRDNITVVLLRVVSNG
ncbi:MAG: Stp1/IreP family PP2C-type Ser/Thr phosphatase [Rhabdochlamydiaceae bacterium]